MSSQNGIAKVKVPVQTPAAVKEKETPIMEISPAPLSPWQLADNAEKAISALIQSSPTLYSVLITNHWARLAGKITAWTVALNDPPSPISSPEEEQ